MALNESKLIGAEVDIARRIAALTFTVLSLPADDRPPPEDPRVRFTLTGVSRVAASLRHGTWNDRSARVEPFPIERLLSVVQGFQTDLYGWEFVDSGDGRFQEWSDRLSLDVKLAKAGDGHTLDLFQEDGSSRILDLRFWFESLTIQRPMAGALTPVSIEEFIAGGRRWWDGLEGGDRRTDGAGIIPFKG